MRRRYSPHQHTRLSVTDGVERGCPTPTKLTFASKAKANKWLRQRNLPQGVSFEAHPYECSCGQWHLSKHKPWGQKKESA